MLPWQMKSILIIFEVPPKMLYLTPIYPDLSSISEPIFIPLLYHKNMNFSSPISRIEKRTEKRPAAAERPSYVIISFIFQERVAVISISLIHTAAAFINYMLLQYNDSKFS